MRRASVQKVVSKLEMDGGGIVKTEFHPDQGWLLVDGWVDMTVVHSFRAQIQACDYPITRHEPNDAIRLAIRRDGDGITIAIDRERGGVWWPPMKLPTLNVRFGSPIDEDRKITISVEGGDLKKPVEVGKTPLFPAAKRSKT